MNTITPIQPNAQPPSVHAGLTPRESFEQQLRIDQVVRATVSEGGQERVWLNIGRQRFLAETEIPLRTGAGLTLVVSKLVPRLEFQILSDPLAGRIRQNLHLLEVPWGLDGLSVQLAGPGTTRESQAVWARFLGLQGALTERASGGSVLAEIFAALGMDYEARLARGDAEAVPPTLKMMLEGAGAAWHGEKEAAPERLEHFSSLFELWQLVRLKQSQESVEFWPLLLPWIEQGFLRAEKGETGGREGEAPGERPWRITLNLQLRQLGALQIDFLWERSGLFLRFQCESAEKANLLSASQEELRNIVSALPVESVAFSVGAQPPAAVLARLIGSEGIVDEMV